MSALEETWNTCPECGHEWKDKTPTPQLLHRIRLCGTCVDFARFIKEYREGKHCVPATMEAALNASRPGLSARIRKILGI